MKLGILVSKRIERGNDKVQLFIDLLKKRNISFCYEQEDKSFDILVTFGGDGLTIKFAKLYADKVPLLAVNMGTVGFLAQIQPDEVSYKNALDKLEQGFYKVVERSTIQVSSQDGILGCAINELLVCNAHRGRTTTVGAMLGRANIGLFSGDGVIVSTPTGSTAYCRTLGGPVLTCDSNCFVMLPVASTGLNLPICYPDNLPLVLNCADSNTEFYLDSDKIENITTPCQLTVTKSDKKALTIQLQEDFFEKIRSSDKVKVAR